MNFSEPTKTAYKTVFILTPPFLIVLFLIGLLIFASYTAGYMAAEEDAAWAAQEEPPFVQTVFNDPEITTLREYTITAYCGCEKCCDGWVAKRKDARVFGAYGIQLQEGVSVASTLPVNTVVFIEGIGTFTVQDKVPTSTAKRFDGKIIDLYFQNHADAVKFGKQQHQVYVLDEGMI